MLRSSGFGAVAAAAVAVAFLAGTAAAGPIGYGDFVSGAGDFTWLDVTESSGSDPTPLFGAPIVVGQSLLFNNMTFSSSSSGVASDITDGQLNTTIMALGDNFITTIAFDEFGDYSLAGLAGEAIASIGASYTIVLLEVDGATLPMPIVGQFNMAFTPDESFELSDEGAGDAVPWQGHLTVDIAQMLADAGIAGGVTKLSLVVDNSLSTASMAGTSAFIAKKVDGGLVITLPAPGALALLGLAGIATHHRRRRHA